MARILTPSPLMGEGWGEGDFGATAPPLNPLPQWGGEIVLNLSQVHNQYSFFDRITTDKG